MAQFAIGDGIGFKGQSVCSQVQPLYDEGWVASRSGRGDEFERRVAASTPDQVDLS